MAWIDAQATLVRRKGADRRHLEDGGALQRHLLVIGGTALVRYTRRWATLVSIWANRFLEHKPTRLVSVAVADKMARIAWVVMTREENYRATPAAV